MTLTSCLRMGSLRLLHYVACLAQQLLKFERRLVIPLTYDLISLHLLCETKTIINFL